MTDKIAQNGVKSLADYKAGGEAMKVLKAILRWCGRHKIWTYFIVTLGGNFLITILSLSFPGVSFMSEEYLTYSDAVAVLSRDIAFLTMILFPPYLLFIWLYGKAKAWHKEKHGNGEE